VYYARWLQGIGRGAEALVHAQLARELNLADEQSARLVVELSRQGGTPEYFLARSLAEYQLARYRESIASATPALALRPRYAEAFNNIAAAHNALGEWDAAIRAGEEAVRLNPSLAIARNNLTFARAQQQRAAAR